MRCVWAACVVLVIPMRVLAEEPQREGLTAEVGIGAGVLAVGAGPFVIVSERGVGGGVGIGGWATPELAITGRVAGVVLSDHARIIGDVIVVSAQYWVEEHVWVGAGAGLAVPASVDDGSHSSLTGVGFDVRVGYSFATGTDHAINLSVELTPTIVSDRGAIATITGCALMLGYQRL